LPHQERDAEALENPLLRGTEARDKILKQN